jgi:large-conductance mechanosensitive channel
LTVSVALAATALLAGFILEQRTIGLGVAVGLVVGAANGELIQRVIASRLPFVVSSILRMVGLSAIAIGIAFLVGASPVTLLLGLATAQLVMVGAAVRQGLRA